MLKLSRLIVLIGGVLLMVGVVPPWFKWTSNFAPMGYRDPTSGYIGGTEGCGIVSAGWGLFLVISVFLVNTDLRFPTTAVLVVSVLSGLWFLLMMLRPIGGVTYEPELGLYVSGMGALLGILGSWAWMETERAVTATWQDARDALIGLAYGGAASSLCILMWGDYRVYEFLSGVLGKWGYTLVPIGLWIALIAAAWQLAVPGEAAARRGLLAMAGVGYGVGAFYLTVYWGSLRHAPHGFWVWAALIGLGVWGLNRLGYKGALCIMPPLLGSGAGLFSLLSGYLSLSYPQIP